MSDNGRHQPEDLIDFHELETEESDEYSEMLLLEDLESLREQMDEAGVDTIDQARRWLASPATDQEHGVPSAADRANLKAVVEMMQDLEVTSREELDRRIRQMHENMDWG